MASVGTVIIISAIIVIILAGSLLGLTILRDRQISSNTTSTSTSSSSASSSSISQTSSSISSSSSSNAPTYSLKLIQAGSGPIFSSAMNSYMAQTYFPGDGPCCSIPPVYSDVVTYNDNGNVWTWQGDLNPGSAYAFANSTGFTLNYNTSGGCPRQEAQAGEGYDDCSFYGSPNGVPQNGLIFSVDVYLPSYSFYSSCQADTGSNQGCTYESLAYDEVALGVVSLATSNSVNVGFAEICNTPCTSNALEMIAYTSAGGSSCENPCPLHSIIENNYSPLHKLTIATDRRSFVEMYVDNNLIYSSSTMPIDLSGSTYEILLSERTSINGETFATTWSNAQIYSSNTISASGLPSGSSLVVNGTNGFSASQSPDSNGNAAVNVAPETSNLLVSVMMNGKVIASYTEPVEAGSVFKLSAS